MSHPHTVLVLTPSLGGHFFGELLAGLAREVVEADARLVVVETLQESAARDEAGAQGDFDTPVAWDEIDGVVSITTAVGPEYLQRVRDDGKPVVLLSSTQMADFAAASARPDNHRGIVAAVDHLVEHGHTRIGFVGNLAQRDIHDRHDAYVEALQVHGLTAEPAHSYAAPENAETGGVVAARAFIAAQDPPTALVMGTDRNAIGFMRALAKAGIDVPQDVAIVSYDNIAAGAFSNPTLTSVDARFDEVGALAGRLIVAEMRGEDVPHTTVTPDSAVLMVRESCGCTADSALAHASTANTQRAARDALADSLLRELRIGYHARDAATRGAIAAPVEHALHLLERGEAATNQEIQALTTALKQVTSQPDTVRRFAEAMAAHSDAPVAASVTAALWKVQAGASLMQADIADAEVAEQYVVDVGLLDTGGGDPRDLHWLRGTRVKAAALALWDDGPKQGAMGIVGTYDPTGAISGPLPESVDVKSFPPAALLDTADAANNEVCVVVPVSTPEHNWGLLSVTQVSDPVTARETLQHWAALLCAALESQSLQEEVKRNALYDGLTGLPNRQFFIQELEHALAHNRRSGEPFAVLFMDLDGFKLVNDTLGHEMGDRVLLAAADGIRSVVRAVDTPGRFGGDEFVVLLTGADHHSALDVAQRIQIALSERHDFDGHTVVTRASIGIATSGFEYANAEDVVRDADTAMYRAKTVEPGSIAMFDDSMHAAAQARAAMGLEVLRGLREGEFEVHYQPIVNLASGNTDRYEALVRWNHPARGMLEPGEFLEEIDETALIVQLGHWVLDEVCRQIAAWGPEVDNVSVNISDTEFWNQDLLARVLATLARHELAPDRLTLEVTEATLMRRPEMALRMMHTLHEAGLRLDIDQFGTGYSSLETLHRFPVDAFKIDRSFIRTLTETDNSSDLISSLVTLGKALGLNVLAEGVETEEQLTSLQQLGCASGQGYLFMPAVTGDRVAEMLAQPQRAKN